MVEGHTAKRSMINLCVYGVPPSPVYKGVEEGRGVGLPLGPPQGAHPQGRPQREVLLPPGVGFPPPSLVGLG